MIWHLEFMQSGAYSPGGAGACQCGRLTTSPQVRALRRAGAPATRRRRNGAGFEIGQPHLAIGAVEEDPRRAAARQLPLGLFDRGGDRGLLVAESRGIAPEMQHPPRAVVPDHIVRAQFRGFRRGCQPALAQLLHPRFLLMEPPLALQHIFARLLRGALGHLGFVPVEKVLKFRHALAPTIFVFGAGPLRPVPTPYWYSTPRGLRGSRRDQLRVA